MMTCILSNCALYTYITILLLYCVYLYKYIYINVYIYIYRDITILYASSISARSSRLQVTPLASQRVRMRLGSSAYAELLTAEWLGSCL